MYIQMYVCKFTLTRPFSEYGSIQLGRSAGCQAVLVGDPEPSATKASSEPGCFEPSGGWSSVPRRWDLR